MTLTRESLILIAICAVDLVTTLLMLNSNIASEGNPLMAFYLKYGVGTFVLMKLTLVALPIFIAEWSMQYRPKFVRFMLRATIAAYLGIYIFLFLTVNVSELVSNSNAAPPPPVRQSVASK